MLVRVLPGWHSSIVCAAASVAKSKVRKCCMLTSRYVADHRRQQACRYCDFATCQARASGEHRVSQHSAALR